MTSLLDLALEAHAAGLAPWPPREDGSKAPITEPIPPDCTEAACVVLRDKHREGWVHRQHVRAPPELLTQLYTNGRTGFGFICGAISGGLELFEFEGRAVDAGLLEEFSEVANGLGLGSLVQRIANGYAEVTPTGGIHLLYRCPNPTTTKLARSPEGVLIETKGEGGFVIVAPSGGKVHPNGGSWEMRSGALTSVATITTDERAELHRLAATFDTMPKPAPRVARAPRIGATDGDSVWEVKPWDDFNARVHWNDILEPHGWRALFTTSGGEEHWCRPGKTAGTSATVAEGGDGPTLYVFTSSTCFRPDEGYGRFGAWAILNHGEDFKAASAALEAAGYGRRKEKEAPAAKARPVPNTPTESDEALPDLDRRHLPEEFWTARAELGHIRQAARARLVSPDAVFGAVLARVAAITPHTVELPPTVGSAMGLTFYTAIVGAPEAGKSAAVAVAAELVPAPHHVADSLPIGSGEGMVETLFEWIDETDDAGKTHKVKKQTKNNAIFRIDEGSALADLASRRGSTLLATIRSAYTGGSLGAANASIETRRILPGGTYSFGVILGIQPEVAGPLLEDAAAGTPQRFIWMAATDPAAPDDSPPWPGLLRWEAPSTASMASIAVVDNGWQRHRLGLARPIYDEVRGERLSVIRGQVERASLDAHGTLARLKVAAVLALLERRLAVTEDDWHLAGIVVDTSRRVRQGVEHALSLAADRKEEAATARHARRELHVEDSKESRALASAAKSVARVIVRHAERQEHDSEGCTTRCLRHAISGKHRAVVSTEEVLAEAERLEWIRAEGEHWRSGESRPA